MSLYTGNSKRERLRRKAFFDAGGDLANESFTRSSAYHRYFEGYAESRIPKKNGKGTRIVRTYIAPYYVQDVSEKQWLQYKMVYAALYLAGVIAFLVGASDAQAYSNRMLYVALPGLLSAFCLFAELVFVLKAVFQKRKMTIGAYHSGPEWFARWSAATAILLVITSAAMSAYAVFGANRSVADIRSSCMVLVAAGVFWMLRSLEKGIHYKRIPNENQPVGDDYVLIQ